MAQPHKNGKNVKSSLFYKTVPQLNSLSESLTKKGDINDLKFTLKAVSPLDTE